MWASHLSTGVDMWVNVYDMDEDDLWPMGRRGWDPEHSAYDRWWLEWTKGVLGVDMLAGGGFVAPPEPLFEWSAP